MIYGRSKIISAIALIATIAFFSMPAILIGAVGSKDSAGDPDWKPDIPRLGALKRQLNDQEYPETLRRPLLSPTRRPPGPRPPEPVEPEPVEAVMPEPVPEPAPSPSPPPDTMVLKGVLMNAARKAALIQSQSQPDGIWVEVGTDVDGWTLRQILPDRVGIDSNGQSATLMLYVDNSAN